MPATFIFIFFMQVASDPLKEMLIEKDNNYLDFFIF